MIGKDKSQLNPRLHSGAVCVSCRSLEGINSFPHVDPCIIAEFKTSRDLAKQHHSTYHETLPLPYVAVSSVACIHCVSAKVSCDKRVPCLRCVEKKLACEARFARKRPRAGRSSNITAPACPYDQHLMNAHPPTQVLKNPKTPVREPRPEEEDSHDGQTLECLDSHHDIVTLLNLAPGLSEMVDQEEQQREAEMEALYQVPPARMRKNEEQEERRRLRREARDRGEYAALREIPERQRASSNVSIGQGQTVDELRAEYARIKKERQRAVSSVSYADLGITRHDGNRLRANSQDSERQGLLRDSATISKQIARTGYEAVAVAEAVEDLGTSYEEMELDLEAVLEQALERTDELLCRRERSRSAPTAVEAATVIPGMGFEKSLHSLGSYPGSPVPGSNMNRGSMDTSNYAKQRPRLNQVMQRKNSNIRSPLTPKTPAMSTLLTDGEGTIGSKGSSLADAGATALLANRRDKQADGLERRGRKVLGGAALGALSAETLTRARSLDREEGGERSRSRSRSSSRHSHSKLEASLNLAATGLAAAAYVSNRRGHNKEHGRSRSRTRSVSRSSYSSKDTFGDERSRSKCKRIDPKYRASQIAKAGVATAAVAGTVEHFRSKSRERSGGERSKSRIRTGAEIAASGLAGAAVAGLHENRTAKEALRTARAEIRMEHGRSRPRHGTRNRSGSRSRGTYSDPGADPELGMVQYGTEPVYTQRSYDNDESDLEAPTGLETMRVAEGQDTRSDTDDQNRALREAHDLDRSFKRPVVTEEYIARLGSKKRARQGRASRPKVKTGCNNCK